MAMIFVINVPSFAITYEVIGFGDGDWGPGESPGIVWERTDWAEVAEVENVVTDPRVTADNYSIYTGGPEPWSSVIWVWGSPGYVQTVFTAPSDSLFVQFESDANDGPADFYIDGVKELSLNTNNGSWFAVVFRDLPWSIHTLEVVATSSAYPKDLAIDAMGSGAPGPEQIEVTIDIKPGSYPNCFNINGKGVIPVAILGSADFDVTQIDVSSLEFAGLEVRIKGNETPQCSYEDVSGDFTSPEGAPDGYQDMVCQFVDNPDTWLPNVGTATLTGNLSDGTPIIGTDSICIVP